MSETMSDDGGQADIVLSLILDHLSSLFSKDALLCCFDRLLLDDREHVSLTANRLSLDSCCLIDDASAPASLLMMKPELLCLSLSSEISERRERDSHCMRPVFMCVLSLFSVYMRW